MVLSRGYAQFVQKPINPAADPYSIYFFNSQLGFLGGSKIQKTTNGGETWSTLTETGLDTLFFNTQIGHHFHFFDPQHGLAVTTSVFDAAGAVMKTDDGGSNWEIIYRDASLSRFPFLGFSDIHFFDADHGFVIGGEGRRIITSNGGDTWTRSDLPVLLNFFDIFFVNNQLGFIAGENTILKTINGGTNWTSTHFDGIGETFTSIFFTDASHGHAVTSAGHIYKTSDGGTSWTKYYFDYGSLNRVFFVNALVGYIAGSNAANHNLLRTLDGGENWEMTEQTFPITLYDVLFSDANTGMACGTNFFSTGYFGKTATGTGNTLPVAHFTVDPPAPYPLCPGTLLSFSNKGNSAYSHSWYINDQWVSNGFNFQHNFSQPGVFEVKLITTNSQNVSVTHVETITVPDPAAFRYNYTLSYSKITCEGNYFYVQVNDATNNGYFYDEQLGPQLELWAGGQKLNAHRDHNRIIPDNGLSGSTDLTLKIFSHQICYDPAQDSTFSVRVIPNSYAADVSVTTQLVCRDSAFHFIVHHSDPVFTYNYSSPGNGITGPSEPGNGGDLDLKVSSSFGEGSYRVVAWSPCREYPGQFFEIKTSKVKADFSARKDGLFNDEPLTVTNKSSGTIFSWDFGEGAQPRFSSQASPPPIPYTTTGLKKLSLSVMDASACQSSKDTVLFVSEHLSAFTPAQCNEGVSVQPPYFHIAESRADRFGNVYQAGFYLKPPWFSVNTILNKYDATGNLVWQRETEPGDFAAFASGIFTRAISLDKDGNIYLAIDFDLPFITFAGKRIGEDGLKTNLKTALIKFSPAGEILWYVMLADTQSAQLVWMLITDVEVDRNGDIILDFHASSNVSNIILRQGNEQTLNLLGPCCDTEFNYIIRLDKNGNHLGHMGYGGHAATIVVNPIIQASWAAFVDADLISPKLAIDEANRIVIAGLFATSDVLKIGPYILEGSQYEVDMFYAILENGQWINAFRGANCRSNQPALNSLTVSDEDQALYVSGHWIDEVPGTTFPLIFGADTVDANKAKTYMMKWNYNGTLAWSKFHRDLTLNGMIRNPSGTLSAIGTLNRFGIFNTLGTHPKGLRSAGMRDPFVAEFDASGNILQASSLGGAADESMASLIGFSCGQIIYGGKQGDNFYIRKASLNGSCSQSPPSLTVSAEQTICAGGTTPLAAAGASTYEWVPAVGLSDPNISNPIASPPQTTLYTVLGFASPACYSSKSVNVIVQDTLAAFSYTTNGLHVNFITDAQQGSSFAWDFGDGQQGQGAAISHTYAAGNSYNACLTVQNLCGTKPVCHVVTVHCNKSVPDFYYDPPFLSYQVQFYDQSQVTTSWHWDFGDGTTSTDQNPNHQFPSPGTYSVCLKAINDCSDSTFCGNVVVPCVLALPGFIFSLSDNQVTFTDTSRFATAWEWSFGDGTGSVEASPTHLYTQAGIYQVCLTASNTCGISAPACKSVQTFVTGLENEVAPGVLLFPNPFREGFTLGLEKPEEVVMVEIWTAQGQCIRRLEGSIQRQNPFNLGAEASGIYFITLYYKRKTVSKSLLKID